MSARSRTLTIRLDARDAEHPVEELDFWRAIQQIRPLLEGGATGGATTLHVHHSDAGEDDVAIYDLAWRIEDERPTDHPSLDQRIKEVAQQRMLEVAARVIQANHISRARPEDLAEVYWGGLDASADSVEYRLLYWIAHGQEPPGYLRWQEKRKG